MSEAHAGREADATAPPVDAAAAGTWRLGDLTVNRVGFGAMRLTGSAAFDLGVPSDRERSLSVLRRAVELGVNHIDTAAFYFSSLRSANELINRALAPYPDDLVIVTKVGPARDASGKWTTWARPEQLRGQVEENLRQLGRDHLDVVNLRVNRAGPLAEHYGALAELRDAGLVRHLGISNVNAGQLAEARTIAPVVCVQNRFGLEVKPADGDRVLRLCGELGIAFVPFFSIVGDRRELGVDHTADTDGDTDDGSAQIAAIATAHGATTTQVRLAWTLQQGPQVLVIPGTGNPDHLVENVAAGALRLSDAELDRLSAHYRPAE
jgi:pyridoxine 4-dehydrogenase